MTWRWLSGEIAVDAILLAEILSDSLVTPSQRGNNVGGWRSGTRLRAWPSAQATLHALERAVDAPIEAWAVVHRDGSYHDWHAHSGVPWKCCGVLYLTSAAACTLFECPCEGELLRSPARAGAWITFPPSLRHRTEPHLDEVPRVTIAFNAR